VRAGSGDDFARLELEVCQEPFVSLEQFSADEWAFELHGFDSGPKRWQMSRC
jgi:hypothetical protein